MSESIRQPAGGSAGTPDPRATVLNELLLEKYEPIAIVGIGLRFPGGSESPGAFTEFLRDGRNGVLPIPDDRWDVTGLAATEKGQRGKIGPSAGGFVDRLFEFDPRFFNISPKEAQYLDPQQRLTLETAWQALEHAGIDATGLRHCNGGVYIGVSCFDYALEAESLAYEDLDPYVGTGTSHSVVPGRLSYFLGWRGPCVAIDTACSSSLVALHLATEGLRHGECDIALAGGVNAIHHPRNPIVFTQAGMLSPDGQCKTFDASADGYGRSEGCGVLVLKRLSDAKRAGDRILALVRGSAVRQDGESGGLTVPNGSAQEAVMRAALARSMLEPGDIGYVEAHGTGTPLGDPIEMAAIRSVFTGSRSDGQPLVVGSLKTNVGHMEAAAGVGGIIKSVLQIQARQFFPHLHLRAPSPHITWDDAVTVPTELRAWPDGPRRALVNSFGFAGTIASTVVEQTPASLSPGEDAEVPGPHIFTLSAKNTPALRLQLAAHQDFLAARPDASLAGICRASNVGRAHFSARISGVVTNRDELAALLEEQMSRLDSRPDRAAVRDPAKVALLFTGQGSQYPGMGRPLARRYPAFRQHLDECDALFEPLIGRSVKELCLDPGDGAADIYQTRYTQPALFAVEYATARLWLSWGIQPSVLIGHSIGEVVAAAVAGLISLPDAVRLVAARGALMQSVHPPGGMVAIPLPAADVVPLLADHADVALAAVNAPEDCVVSGGERSLAEVTAALTGRGVTVKPLRTSHAFHSPLMAQVAGEFRDAIKDIRFREPDIAIVSNLTGEVGKPGELATADYWVRHMLEPVNFAAGMRAIERRGEHAHIEVGPSASLISLGKRCVTEPASHRWVASMHREDPDGVTILRSLTALYTAGITPSWREFHDGQPGGQGELPTYAFDRKHYWLPITGKRHAMNTSADPARMHHPLLGEETTSPERLAAGEREFTARITPDFPPWLADHVVMGQVVFPAAGFVEILLALEDAVYGETSRPLLDVDIHEPLLLGQDQSAEVRTRLHTCPGGDDEVEIESLAPGAHPGVVRCHVTARIGRAGALTAELTELGQELRRRGADDSEPATQPRAADDLYPEFADLGLEYGPQFQRIIRLSRRGDDTGLAEHHGWRTGAVEQLPPPVLDNVIQSLAAVVEDGQTYLPVRFGRLLLLKKPKGATLRSVVRRTTDPSARAGELTADMVLLDGDEPVVIVRSLGFRRVVNTGAAARRQLLHQPRWLKRSLVRSAGAELRILAANGSEAQLEALFAAAGEAGTPLAVARTAEELARQLAAGPSDVFWFWQPRAEPMSDARLRAETEHNYRQLLQLLGVLDEQGFGRDQRLWLVTQNAQRLADDPADDGAGLPAATLWGFGLTMWSELPAYRVTLIDLDSSGDQRSLLAECLGGAAEEFQVAYRGTARHVRRIVAVPAAVSEENFELTAHDGAGLAGVKAMPVPDVPPRGDEIQVQVQAAGLNFKDVLNALGLLRQHAQDTGADYVPLPLGFEAAGRVVAAGPDAGFRPGDRVILSHLGCMRRRVTAPSAAAARMPDTLSFAAAAGLPTAYITAYYALHSLAGIKPGDRVLIHAAAGGVGQAAVQLATLAGAEVYATASPGKHELLRSQGIRYVMNSRTLDFADEVARHTGGAGVDIVLNSLNKDYIPAGLRVLAAGGRFVELGKIGVWSAEQMSQTRPDVTYHNFDLSEFPEDQRLQVNGEILRTVVQMVGDGRLRPLPVTVYGKDEAEEAFSVLSRGANVGKLILSLTDEQDMPARPARISPDRTYVITGGLGALGVLTARGLAERGARHLALVSRRAATAEQAAELERGLPEGTRVSVHQADVSTQEDVDRLMAELDRAARPIGGVVHAAGELDDAPLSALTWERIDKVFGAKVYGTWLLHQALAGLPDLAFFAGYSSISAVIGPPGQANYAAGNAFLDAVMNWRAADGLPGLSVNWGPWAEVGMAAKLGDRHTANIEAQGMHFVRPAQGMKTLVTLLDRPFAQIMVGGFDWDRLAATRPAANALYQRLTGNGGRAEAVRVDLDGLLALPRAERQTALTDIIRGQVAKLLHYDGADDVPGNAKFAELGMDSLVSVEMKNMIEAGLRMPLPTSLIFDYPTVGQLADFIEQRLTAPADDGGARPDDDLLDLSDSEIASELAALRDL